jgi:hypothetical protein
VEESLTLKRETIGDVSTPLDNVRSVLASPLSGSGERIKVRGFFDNANL